ncbi:MAG: XRE family transcriptional regulator [Desulfurellales bacterium]|nr:MAG: XRE family transcriptional regulator [Desulfurellales bacterium]
MTPGEVMQRAREKLGKTQAEAAEALGVSQPTIADWEGDKVHPRSDRIYEIAAWYKVAPTRLLPPPKRKTLLRRELAKFGEAGKAAAASAGQGRRR